MQNSVLGEFVVTVQQDFEETMVERGIFQMDSSKREVIKKYVNTTLFRELKFIGHESPMELKGPLSRKIMKEFAVMPRDQMQFWDKYKSFINTTIRTKRNNINMTLKDNYMSKFCLPIMISGV